MTDQPTPPPFTPADALDTLPRLAFEPASRGTGDEEFRRAELLQSVLAIARVDHLSESELVREAAKAALGKLPEIE